jgi:hypothetical protein
MQRGDTQPEWSIPPPNNIDLIEVLGSSADRPTIPPTNQSGLAAPHSLNDTGSVGTAILGIEVLDFGHELRSSANDNTSY